MASKQIDALTALTAVATGDEIPIYDISAGGEAKKITQDDLLDPNLPTVSVDNEVALFSSTTGRVLKRASSTGIAKVTAGVLSAITDSSGLAGAISDETGSGALVFGTSPTLSTPVINTPTIKTWDGWNTVSDAWSYASASTITVPSGAASLYQKGDKIKMTNSGTKFLVVTTVADTLLTVTGGSDYTVANAAISSIFISHFGNPIGFPDYFNYTPTGPTNTTMTARFKVIGKTCFMSIHGAVTGTPDFTNMPTIPIAVSASFLNTTADYMAVGSGGYLDSGTANKVGGVLPVLGSSDTRVRLNDAYGTDTTQLTSTKPITWANNDKWWVSFNYEI